MRIFFLMLVLCLLVLPMALARQAVQTAEEQQLVSPFDAGVLLKKEEEEPGEKFHCRGVPEPQQDLIYESIYSDRKESASIIDKKAQKIYKAKISSLSRYERHLSEMSDMYALTGYNRSEVAACVLNWLYVWADKKAYLGEVNGQGEAIRKWGLAVLATSYAKIRHDGHLSKDKDKVVRRWLRKIATTVKDDYSQHLHRRTRSNNHVYWAAWSVMIAGVVLNDHGLYDWAVEHYRKALKQIDQDGTLPLELARKGMAFNYHVFAVGPLVSMAETAKVNNLDLYEEEDGALHRLVARIMTDLGNGQRHIKRKTGVKQEVERTLVSWHWAWLEVYYKHYPSHPIESFLKEKRPTVQRRLGGDLTAFYAD